MLRLSGSPFVDAELLLEEASAADIPAQDLRNVDWQQLPAELVSWTRWGSCDLKATALRHRRAEPLSANRVT